MEQLVAALEISRLLRDLGEVFDSVDVHERGNRERNPVRALGNRHALDRIGAEHEARAHSALARASKQHRKHADGAYGLLAVLLALGPKALHDEARGGIGDFVRQILDNLYRDARDRACPLGRLRSAIWAFAQDMALVVALGSHSRCNSRPRTSGQPCSP